MQNIRRFWHLQIPVLTTGEFIGRTSRITNWVPSRNAGHSKWANIRHTKGAKDLERSKQIIKFHSRIQIAIRGLLKKYLAIKKILDKNNDMNTLYDHSVVEKVWKWKEVIISDGGGPDAKYNTSLSNVLQEAKNAKLPMTSIQKMIDSINKSKTQCQNEVWPLKGPGSSIILVEVFTDNRTKVKNDLNTVLRKNKGLWIETSAVKLFECNGIIRCSDYKENPPTEEFLEECTAHAIEAGANDVTIQETPDHGIVYEFTTAPSGIHKIKNFLENLGYKCASSEVVYTPNKRLELDDADLRLAAQLCDKILDHPEVLNVYDNIK